ncbi:MAG: neutral zinc metallopeptidase [Planctomycetaceae bacterium]|nr:neutral zinc metallopeptidase [Planctomycetaceae bacterium]
MKLGHVRESDNVQDRRAMGPRKVAAGGGLGLILMIGLILLSGGNLGDVLKFVVQNQANVKQGAPAQPLDPAEQAAQDEQVVFVKKVLALTEDVWQDLFTDYGKSYAAPDLEIFRGSTSTACGHGAAAMGPFYCPADAKVYIDLSFYDQLRTQLNSPGDFAQAYVIAHEVGHHVQNQLGYSDLVHRARQTSSEEEANQMSVRLELQADYLAGVWAYHAQQAYDVLERGDIEEGLNAARQIGDDMLQKKSRGVVVPEQFTHGTSAQRVHWFREGLKSGDPSRKTLDQFFEMPYDSL